MLACSTLTVFGYMLCVFLSRHLFIVLVAVATSSWPLLPPTRHAHPSPLNTGQALPHAQQHTMCILHIQFHHDTLICSSNFITHACCSNRLASCCRSSSPRPSLPAPLFASAYPATAPTSVAGCGVTAILHLPSPRARRAAPAWIGISSTGMKSWWRLERDRLELLWIQDLQGSIWEKSLWRLEKLNGVD